MSPTPPDHSRPCVAVEIPPGPAGLEVLVPALAAALEGTGPAIAPVPRDGPPGLADRIRSAVRPGQPVPDEVAVVLATSGSTGDPAGVLLSAASLRAAARGFAERMGTPQGHQWVAALPLHTAGGLMVAVRALVAGTQPVATTSLGGGSRFTSEDFRVATEQAWHLGARDGRPLATSLVPPMLATLDDAGPPGRALLAQYGVVLVGGAAAPRALVERLRLAGIALVTSYGMTETCGGVVFDSLPLAGVRVVTGANGRLRIAGEQVALGYRDGRQAGRWDTELDGVRWFTTADLGHVTPAGLVEVTGRADDVVQVGGTAVSLQAVREVLMQDARVGQAHVVALPDQRWGARLVALVVPAGPARQRPTTAPAVGAVQPAGTAQQGAVAPPERGAADSAGAAAAHEPDAVLCSELASAVRATLGGPAAPRAVHVLAGLPEVAPGKVDRRALESLARSLEAVPR